MAHNHYVRISSSSANGKFSVWSVYILLECFIQTWILLGLVLGRTMLGSGAGDGVDVALVKRKPYQVCAMCPWTISSDFGRYCFTLSQFKPGQVMKFPDFIDFSHVDLTVNPAAACKYLTTASTLGRSYALLHSKYCPVLQFWISEIGAVGVQSGNIHNTVVISCQRFKTMLSSLFLTTTWSWEKVTVHPVLHNGPIPTRFFLKFGIMWAYVASLGILDISSMNPLDDFCMLPVAVPTAIISALVLLLLHGAYSEISMLDDPESTRPVMFFGTLKRLIVFLVVLRALLTML